jgi:hypothetical protein
MLEYLEYVFPTIVMILTLYILYDVCTKEIHEQDELIFELYKDKID